MGGVTRGSPCVRGTCRRLREVDTSRGGELRCRTERGTLESCGSRVSDTEEHNRTVKGRVKRGVKVGLKRGDYRREVVLGVRRLKGSTRRVSILAKYDRRVMLRILGRNGDGFRGRG